MNGNPSMSIRPRLALIHAVTLAIDPIQQALRTGWPEVEAINILDDSLPVDRARDPDVTPRMRDRIVHLARYAHGTGAEAVLFTCSAFGSAIEEADRMLPIPVLKPNEAMFEAAIACGRKIGMIVSFPPAAATMEAEFREQVAQAGLDAKLSTVIVPDAIAALRRRDVDTHNALIAEAAEAFAGQDAIMLAQFSMAVAASDVRARVATPIFTSPDSAVEKVKRLVLAARASAGGPGIADGKSQQGV